MEAPPPQLGAPRHAQRTLLGSLPGLNSSCPASHSTVAVCRRHSSTQARPSGGRAELGGPGRSSPHCTCRPGPLFAELRWADQRLSIEPEKGVSSAPAPERSPSAASTQVKKPPPTTGRPARGHCRRRAWAARRPRRLGWTTAPEPTHPTDASPARGVWGSHTSTRHQDLGPLPTRGPVTPRKLAYDGHTHKRPHHRPLLLQLRHNQR